MLSHVQFLWRLCVGHLRMHRFPAFPVCQPAYSCHPILFDSSAVAAPLANQELRNEEDHPESTGNRYLFGNRNTRHHPTLRAIKRRVNARLRAPKQPDPVSHIFTILPDVDSPTLLAHASETLASLNVMSTDLADQLEGSHRNVALAIQQLAVLAEMLINRALDNLDSPESKVKPVCH